MLRAVRDAFLGIALAAAATAGAAAQSGPPSTTDKPRTETAIFAGGCFWCVEADFDKVDGVVSTTSGYIGGRVAHPTYRQVSAGGTGHTEAVEILYDPRRVSYRQLLQVFWRNHDPLVKNRQFCDRGDQYRAAIFYRNEEQRRLAEASKREAAALLKAPIHTEIAAAGPFYRAEEYHQDYYKKNPIRYQFYRYNCGRDRRLEQIWGKGNSSS